MYRIFFSDLRLLKKPSDGLTLPSRADFVTQNPRMAMFRFGIPAVHAVYKNYKPVSTESSLIHK